MARSLNDFKKSFSGDLARTNRFDVSIPVPITLLPYVGYARELKYRCETAQLPGRSLATLEQKTYGPIEKHPYMSTYNDIDLTFIVEDGMEQRIFFDSWINFINPTYNNNFRYKDTYAINLGINQYNLQNDLTYSVNLYEAYPVSMNQLDLDWNGEGYHKLTVTFAYTYWKNNTVLGLGLELLDSAMDTVSRGWNADESELDNMYQSFDFPTYE
jgi:hypothetical protein